MTTSFRSLEMRRQCVERRSLNYDFAGFNLIIERHRIAAALESDSGEVDGDIALLADDLAILLVIARVTAVIACVKTDTVRSTILFDDDEAFERIKGQILCLHPGLAISEMDYYKVVHGGRLVDLEEMEKTPSP